MLNKHLVTAIVLSFALSALARAEGDFTIGPDYTNAPELTAREGVPRGVVHAFTMSSEESKIYPGLNGPYQRGVWVYVPSQYVPGTPAPFIVAQDGKGYTNRLPVVLDNMIHDHRLPAMIAVMINSGGGDGKGSERGLEYDTVSDKYTMFIEKEVLPKIEKDFHVRFTTDPNDRATMGGSSGAACAFTMAWFHPELYRRVLSYSGTYVNQQSPENPASPHGAWEYHEHLIPQSEAKPLRVWLQVGEKDNGWERAEATYHNWVLANQRMASVLKAKGYEYEYWFCRGAGHVDRKAVGQTLPEALAWLWQGYGEKADITMDFSGAPVSVLLDQFSELAGKKVTMAAGLHSNHKVSIQTDHPLTRSRALQLLERVMKDQAGIVIVRNQDGSLTAAAKP